MSVSEVKENACNSKTETDISNKPCIDFQPGDRWQIKDEIVKDQENSQESKIGEANHSNGRRSMRLRKSKSNDSPLPNGVSTDNQSEELPHNTSHNSCENDNNAIISEKHINTKQKRKSDKGPNNLETNNKKMKLNETEQIISEEPEQKVNDEELPLDKSEASRKEESMDCEDSKPSTNDLDASIEILDDDEDVAIKGDSVNNKDQNDVSNDSSKDDNSTKDNEKKVPNDDDIEVININDDDKKSDNESDSEIQIINMDLTSKPAVIEFPSLPSTDDVTLTAGYPYYNSLKEKIPDFIAGDYKPVKFPHTGTLLLADNEVIIESPSLLVPLLIKESDKFPKNEGGEKKVNGENNMANRLGMQRKNFFQSSVGQFLINLGMSRVQEWYHRDTKRIKLKQLRSKKSNNTGEDLEKAITIHSKRYSELKEINAIFNFRMKQCKFCGFKSESAVIMEGHYLTPHISPRKEFKCNFCMFLSRTVDAIVFHYEAIHQKKAVIESNVPLHECIFCSFQSHLKTKVTAHMNRCRKHFFPSQNLAPPFDFEFPGVTTKPVTIADVIGHRRLLMNSAKNRMAVPDDNPNSAYARKKLASVLSKLSGQTTTYPDMKNASIVKQLMTPQSNLPPLSTSSIQLPPGIVITRPRGQPIQQMRPVGRFPQPRGVNVANLRTGQQLPRRPFSPNLSTAASQLASSGISITPVTRPGVVTARPSVPGVKNVTLTPISVTQNKNVSPRPGAPQPMALFTNVAGSGGLMGQPQAKFPPNVRPLGPAAPYQRLTTPPSQVVKGSSGNTFVVCEICDSYVKDLEELRTHMNWVHKVKIHPKMLVSRPPLNCQKCQWRFFTDQGLERHLLGAHGLVTTNMQEMANKNSDGGRCIICAAVFTYKLVSHMTQVHKVTLKPAHLSYKCTVCTATFTLYRLFESHVYNVHSGSGKRSAEESETAPPPKKVAIHAGPRRCKECGFVTENLMDHIIEKHMKKCMIKLCRIEKCKKCLYSSDEMLVIRMSDFGLDSDVDDSADDDEDEGSSEESSEDEKKNETG